MFETFRCVASSVREVDCLLGPEQATEQEVGPGIYQDTKPSHLVSSILQFREIKLPLLAAFSLYFGHSYFLSAVDILSESPIHQYEWQ